MQRVVLVGLVLTMMVAGCLAPGHGGSSGPTATIGASSSASHASSASSSPPARVDACAGVKRADLTLSQSNHTVVAIDSSAGCMVAELYDDKAPLTVANFKTYVTEGFYKDRQFYRIVPGFVNQGGGERQGETGKHPGVKNEEKSSGLHNYQYTLSMARTSAPDSGTTEFFINAANNTAGHRYNLDPGGVDAYGYAVFGVLVQGRDVSDTINTMANAPAPTFSIRILEA